MKKLVCLTLSVILALSLVTVVSARFTNIIDIYCIAEKIGSYGDAYALMNIRPNVGGSIELLVTEIGPGTTRSYSSSASSSAHKVEFNKKIPIQSGKVYSFKFTFISGGDEVDCTFSVRG